jgi:deoxyribonuclease-4
VSRAFERGRALGCETIQIFASNASRWRMSPLPAEERERFLAARQATGIAPCVVHSAYLINLAGARPDLLARSRERFLAELERCEALEVPFLVLHPGAHLGLGESEGIARVAAELDAAHRALPGYRVRTALETTAGQGSSLGHRFAQLRAIMERVREPERLAVCLDTAHIFAAGYDIATPEGTAATLEELERELGLASVVLIHVNDSRRECGSRVDRHASLGEGRIGLPGLRGFLRRPELAGRPLILELPPGEGGANLRENLARLRELVGAGA